MSWQSARERRTKRDRSLPLRTHLLRACGILAADLTLATIITLLAADQNGMAFLLIGIWQFGYKIPVLIVMAIGDHKEWMYSLVLSWPLLILLNGLGCAYLLN